MQVHQAVCDMNTQLQRHHLRRQQSAPPESTIPRSLSPESSGSESGTIFTRLCIRRVPENFIEPTSTLLLTSPANRFIDLRLSRNDHTTLLVASIGQCTITTTHAIYTHDLHLRPSPVPCMTFAALSLLANGDVLHVHEGYEEIWRPCALAAADRVCIVLALRRVANGHGGWRFPESECAGLVVRIGGWCQGMVRTATGARPTVERWVRRGGSWTRVVRCGKESLPCAVACLDRDEKDGEPGKYWRKAEGMGMVVEKTVAAGEMVIMGRGEWEIVERAEW